MPKKTDSIKASGHWWKAIFLLSLPLLILFRHGFIPEMVLFSNDGPLGVISASAGALPGAFFGYWHDLNWVGMENPSALPDFSMGLGLLTQNPIIYSKIYAPVALLFLGFSAWVMGRSMQWNPWVCVLVGLAAALNSNAFSNACWGLPSRATTMASVFLALAAIHASRPKTQLLRYLLAGFAIGRLIKPGLVTRLDGGHNGSGLSFPACRIALLRLVSSKPLGVLRKYFLIGCQIIMKLGLETLFHHFLDLLVGDFFRRIRGVHHRQTKAGDHQA